ncbi:protein DETOXIFICATION 45, chloroplastic [Malania oleifera]|uniref:protein DETOXIFICATION 45, chloroplastic n=1 Tax=Malania oleifera TaxID=397392 RepID=UPI0025ADE59D|nr:protein DETOXIFICATION 45, chloroplastic [Malania oleifera]XP_057966348.1 protein DETOXIFICATION 45, chloroplastic [Malania oleifera]
MTIAQLAAGCGLSSGLTSKASEWNSIKRRAWSLCLGQSSEASNSSLLIDRKELRYRDVVTHCYPLVKNHRKPIPVLKYQSNTNHGVGASDVDERFALEEVQESSGFREGNVELTGTSSGPSHSWGVKHELLMLSLPAIAGQAIEPLAQLMETAYIGRLGPVELASAGVSVSIFNIVSKLFNIPLLSVATSFVAEDISKNATKDSLSEHVCQEESPNGKPFDGMDERMQLPSVSTALLLAVGIGLFEALALYLGSGMFLNLMGVSLASSMRTPAQQFLSLRALGAPAVVVSLALQGIFRGFKDTKTPVLCLGVGNFAAALLFPILMYYFQFGVTGAAISTVVSQYVVTFLMIWYLNKRAVLLPPKMAELQFGGYIKSGGFLLGRTLAVLVTMTLGTSMAARQGPVAMAAHQICLQVWLAVSLITDALAASGQALIASSLSKGDYMTAREITDFVLKIGLLTGVILAAILGLSFGSLANLFTKDTEVLGIVRTGVLFVSASQPINSLAFIFDGLHYGVSDFPYAACSMMAVGAMSSAFLLCAPSNFGLPGVWSGLALFMGLRMVAGYIRLASKTGPWWFLHTDNLRTELAH